jgi:type III secretion protein J
VLALTENDIGAVKENDPSRENLYRVSVASDDVSIALVTLRNAGLPLERTPGVLDSIGESGLVPSRASERARWLVGTAGELERSLQALNGVLSARVHLAVPDADPLSLEERRAPSASVLLRHKGASPPLSAAEVQRLVSGAVSGLAAEHVAVVMHPVPETPLRRSDSLTTLGPLSLTRSSANSLRLTVAAVGALNIVLVAGLLSLWSVWRRARREAAELRLQSNAPESSS